MIKAIIFDCYGVLTSGKWQAFWQSLPTHKMQGRARDLNRAYDGGHIEKDVFFKELSQLTGIPETEIRDELLNDDDYHKNNSLLAFIKSLGGKYKLSILSNIASNWITDELLNDDEQALFDDILPSHEVGMTKPDPRIFKLACDRLGVQPSEAILVDDIETYCLAAERLGMKTIVYKDSEQCKKELEKLLAEN